MLYLNTTSEELTLETASSTGIMYLVSYIDMDITAGTIAPSTSMGTVAAVTTTTILSSPASGIVRQIKYFSIFNNDASADHDIKVHKYNGSNYTIASYTLPAGSSLEYTEDNGIAVFPPVGSSSGAGLVDGDYGDITVGGSGTTMTIDAGAVGYSKIQDVSATARILGRNTAGAGSIEELTASTVKSMLSLNNVENTALSTWAGTSNITTLGTITTGTWSATNVALDKGGTNAALTADQGAIVYSTSSALALLASTSTATKVLLSGASAAPTWSSYRMPTSVGAANSTITSDGTNFITTPAPNTLFFVTRSTAQTITTSTYTKMQLNTESYDGSNTFDNATNYRHTPTTAGKYFYIGMVSAATLGDQKGLVCNIYKNGSLVAVNFINASGSTGTVCQCSCVLDMNGSTDYVELYIWHNHGSDQSTIASASYNFLIGVRVE